VAATLVLLTCACQPPTATTGVATTQQSPSIFQSKPAAAEPPKSDPTEIVRVICHYSPWPWLSFDVEGNPDPEGFGVVVYLASSQTGKGVFTEGQLHVEMYRWQGAGKDRARERVCDWTQPLEKLPRAKRETVQGWAYAPQFYWGDADVLGRDIDVVISYLSPSGRVVRAVTKPLRVPARRTT